MSEPSHFAVVRERGPAWDRSRTLEQQWGWEAHARFMNGLVQDGFVRLGGPLEDDRVLLICRARDEDEVKARLSDDPWPTEMLTIGSVRRWTILLEEGAA